MSKIFGKDETISHKKNAIRQINNLIEHSICTGDYKKANLLAYWIEEFSSYISQEKSFDPTRIISYSRGDIVKLNFGFRIGNEYGGLHYAIIIENMNSHNDGIVTVIPLTSYKDGKKINQRSVDLGSELYEKVSARQKVLLDKETENVKSMQGLYESIRLSVESSEKPDEHVLSVKTKLEKQIQEINADIANLQRNEREITKMKEGSIALVNQITAISKQRIYTPKKSADFLYGISLSNVAMEKLNDKITELFLH